MFRFRFAIGVVNLESIDFDLGMVGSGFEKRDSSGMVVIEQDTI